MKLQTRKFVSMLVAFVIILVCAVPALATESSDATGYAVNQNGETYGNYLEALEIGYEADLILAEGIDGTLGYVKTIDLDDNVETPSDVVLQTGNTVIPLYASDGITIVGQFLIVAQDTMPPQTREDYVYSASKTVSNGYYQPIILSGIKGSPGGVTAMTQVIATGSVDTRHVGVNVRCYRESNGALVKSSGWKYNTSPTSVFSYEMFYRNPYTSNQFYSCGEVKVFNPISGEFTSYTTYRTTFAYPEP